MLRRTLHRPLARAPAASLLPHSQPGRLRLLQPPPLPLASLHRLSSCSLRIDGACSCSYVGARGLCTGPRPLPTIEEVRAFSRPELEDARLRLSRALGEAEEALVSAYDAEEARRRTSLARLLGATLLRLGSPLDAERVISDALECEDGAHGASEEELTELTFLRGVCYQKSGREESALDAFEAVLRRTDGEHWRARFHMALLSLANQWHDQGEALLRGVLERNPEHAESRRLLAMLEERREAEANRLVPPEDFSS